MNVLLLGSGGREHALAYAVSKSYKLAKLFIAPGNAGMISLGEIVLLDIGNHEEIIRFCRNKEIDLVVIGPEAPLVEGLVDDLSKAEIRAFGPTKGAAQLEGSKGFTKDICREYDIPTAAYGRFNKEDEAKNYIKQQGCPIVVKADGLAAGKGVIIAMNEEEALNAVEKCFQGGFGQAGQEVVIEEFLEGEEASFFALSDGKNILPLASAQDHKRVGEGDKGPNTGGMGAYSPAPIMDEKTTNEVIEKIIKPTIKAMNDKGHPYQGVLFAGLMITKDGPKLIEHNCRFGDPECQVLMMRLKSDLLDLLNACVNGTLDEVSASWSEKPALTVVMASKGYPSSYQKNTPIDLENVENDKTVEIFHAGTTIVDGKLVATGGRVLNVTAEGDNVRQAQEKAYEVISKIKWENGFYRKDIGWRAL